MFFKESMISFAMTQAFSAMRSELRKSKECCFTRSTQLRRMSGNGMIIIAAFITL